MDVRVDLTGDLYVAGTFHDSILLDGTLLYQNGKDDLLLIKLDPIGSVIWAKQTKANGLSGAMGLAMDLDGDGNIYIGGYFSGNAQFGLMNVNANSDRDLFIAKYDASGACLGVRQATNSRINNLQVNRNNEIIASGSFTDVMTAGSISLASYGDEDVFILTCDGMGMGDGKTTGNSLFIYPNPNAGICAIVVPDELLKERYLELRIFDNSGRLLQQKTFESHDGSIYVNLETEAKGVYQVTLGNGDKQNSGTIVFE